MLLYLMLFYLMLLCLLASLMKNSGVIIANDASKERLSAVIGNIHRLGMKFIESSFYLHFNIAHAILYPVFGNSNHCEFTFFIVGVTNTVICNYDGKAFPKVGFSILRIFFFMIFPQLFCVYLPSIVFVRDFILFSSLQEFFERIRGFCCCSTL